MKGIYRWSIAVSASILIAGCSYQSKNADLKSTIIFRLAENHPSNHPTTLADEEFARLVKEKTNGKILIKVYDNKQLGEEKSIVEQVQFGAIDFARVSTGQMTELFPVFNVLQLPYIYHNSDHMWQVLNSSIGDSFLDLIQEEGFLGLGWYDAGARNFYNSVREIHSLQDLQGLKFRSMENRLMMDIIQALGASVVPMPYGEVYGALQTGVIDGAENNIPSYETASHFEVARYYTIDEHIRVPEILIASQKIMDRISKEELAIIKECAEESQIFQRRLWKEKEAESEKKILEAGCTITEIQEKEPFIQAVSPVYYKYAKDYMDMVKQIQEMQ